MNSFVGEEFFSASAPGRCGIIGNPSDMYGGHVVSASIPVRNRFSMVQSAKNDCEADTRLLDAVKARYPKFAPLNFIYETQVPRSSGLSGSTAMLAAILACAMEHSHQLPDLQTVAGKTEFAEILRDTERNEANVVCGFQDAYMIAFGGVQSMDFEGKHPIQKGPNARLENLACELPFLLITTGVERLSGSVHGPLSQRWLAGDHLVRENIQRCADLGRLGCELLKNGDWCKLAEKMDENQRWIAEMGGSGDAIDRLIEDCKQSGAMAAKLAGAGMGGTVIALTLNKIDLEQNLRQKGYTRFYSPEAVDGIRLENSS